ncbi:MAG: hypothetical protein JW902_01700 [Syntrophaceae bacterium]|nr:hypothetical protein [Syntrophaceae bacterium]
MYLKRFINIMIFLCFVLLIPHSGLNGKEFDPKKNAVDRNLPIQIVSDRMDAYNEKRMVIFDGNAIATQGDRTIRADTITLYYKKREEKSGPADNAGIQKGGDLDKIEARGHVRITQGGRIVTGNEAIYLQDAQKIIIKGNAVLSEGKNVIRGEQVVVYINENRGVVEGIPGERVNATIFPAEKRESRP